MPLGEVVITQGLTHARDRVAHDRARSREDEAGAAHSGCTASAAVCDTDPSVLCEERAGVLDAESREVESPDIRSLRPAHGDAGQMF